MKKLNVNTPARMLLCSLLLSGASSAVLAGGTSPGQLISNSAVLDYQVGGIGQTSITSDGDTGTPGDQPTNFLVDRKVGHTVLSNGNATVIPNSNDQAVPFTLTNNGNDTQGYVLSTIAGIDGTDDDFDMNSVEIYIDSGVIGTYEPGTDTLYAGGNAGDLAPDASIDLLVVSDTPATPTNGQTSLYHLIATATDAGTATVTTETAGADDPTAIDVAFADASGSEATDTAQDGVHSASATYAVSSAAVAVTKTSAVTDDGFGNGPGSAKAIPGATITYSVVIDNSGGATDATTLVVNDDIQVADVDSTGTLASVAYDAGCNGATSESFASPTLTMNVATVAAGATCTITFDVIIN